MGKTEILKKKYPGIQYYDLKENFLMPGLINAHTHLYSTLARGLSLRAKFSTFKEILENLWWHLDKNLKEDDIYYSALIGGLESIKYGVTTIIDHHASPNCLNNSLDIIDSALSKINLRRILCYEVSDRDGEKIAQTGIEENIRFIKKCEKEKNNFSRACFGLHAAFTLSNKTLEKCMQANYNKSYFHLHLAEDNLDLEENLKNYNLSPIQRLNQIGLFDFPILAAHCVHILPAEKTILKEKNIKVIHNPQSNMNNAVGRAYIPEMLKRDIFILLGSDGYTLNMFNEAKIAPLLQRSYLKDLNAFNLDKLYKILFLNNSKIAGFIFNKVLGEIKIGAEADLIILNYFPPTEVNASNFMCHFVLGMDPSMISMVIIKGEIIFKDKKFTGLNEIETYKKSREVSKKLWRRL
ncbi:MAG: putative aminohydrolase SsnA [Armatimonadetes bacterium]|nr:putative aminohydrolase SsnA [Armatimonadota bacterium]